MATKSFWGLKKEVEHLVHGARAVEIRKNREGLLLAPKYAETHIPNEVLKDIPFGYGAYHFENMEVAFFFIPQLLEKQCQMRTKGRRVKTLTSCNYHLVISEMQMYNQRIWKKYPLVAKAFLERSRKFD